MENGSGSRSKKDKRVGDTRREFFNLRKTQHGTKGSMLLLVYNLPSSMTTDWLRQLFKYEGDLVDVYLSCKIRKNKKDGIGFVRFESREEALKVVGRMDGIIIKDCTMQVSLDKYKHKEKKELCYLYMQKWTHRRITNFFFFSVTNFLN